MVIGCPKRLSCCIGVEFRVQKFYPPPPPQQDGHFGYEMLDADALRRGGTPLPPLTR